MSTDDESFHPLGSEWEGELEEMLDDTEYDTDLGLEMAKDAMRVTKGELSEAEFHEKYHDDVMAEFGEDQRPTQEAYEQAKAVEDGTFSRMLDKFDGDGEDGRRDMMKKMGVGGAAFVGLSAWSASEDPDPEASVSTAQEDAEQRDIQWGMTLDLEQCDGCLSCVTACANENQLDSGVNWMYVLDYEDGGADTSRNRLIRPCQHCTDAPCEKVCPTTARHTRESDGLVLTDYDVCIGCRYCQVACPYGVNYFQWEEPEVPETAIADHMGVEPGEEGDHMMSQGRWVDSRAPRGVMSKCTMCPTRQDGNMGEGSIGTTACQDACPPGAIQFGNVHDDLSDASKYADNPSRGRALWNINPPSASELEEELDGVDDDLESVLEATDLDEDELAFMLAIDITAEEMGARPDNGEQSQIADREDDVSDALGALEDHGLDLDSPDVLVPLGLADEPDDDGEFDGPDEDDAQNLLENEVGSPESNFKLLEDIGTNPNITYLGNEPGPRAEQVDGPVAYEDVNYQGHHGEEVDIVDDRKEVLDEYTVGLTGRSL